MINPVGLDRCMENLHLLIFSSPELAGQLDQPSLISCGWQVTLVSQLQEIDTWLKSTTQNQLLVVVHQSTHQALNYSAQILQNHPSLPIILVTPAVEPSDLKQALEMGLVDCLLTPVDMQVLISTIKRAVNRQRNNQSSLRLSQVLNELVDGFVLVDRDSRLLFVNRAGREIFGVKDDQLEGKLVDEVFTHPDFLDIFKPYREFPYQNEITLDDGHVFSTHSSLIPEIGIALILHEITRLKELDQLKTDFVNTVSHDLRSPLTAVYGFVGLIDRVGPINQQQAEFLRHIQSSLQNITLLINDLLDLGRIEASKDIQMVDVNLKDILHQAIKNLDYQSSEKMQEVELTIPDEMPLITGNPLHLQRMVSNLLENAIKFTPLAGKITIQIRVEGGQLFLEVADNGPGIPIDDQPHIFEKFFRGSNISESTAGTGLGLSIVKSIAEKHQGRIWLESSPLGSTFTVILPLK